MSTLNKTGYKQLIEGDLDYLLKQPKSLERDHIEAVLRYSADKLYDRDQNALEAVNRLVDMLCEHIGLFTQLEYIGKLQKTIVSALKNEDIRPDGRG